MSLLVTGSIALDTVETPVGSVRDALGGSCVFAAAAARFFTPVRVSSVVGGDFPNSLQEDLANLNLDLCGLERRAESKTFRWWGRYYENMNHRETIEVHQNVLEESLSEIPHEYLDSRYLLLGHTNPFTQLEIRRCLPTLTWTIADTMAIWIRSQRRELQLLIEQVDGFLLNSMEAELLTGLSDAKQAARAILAMGPRFVIVKLGSHGAVLAHRDGLLRLPAFRVANVADPTGAGDAFAGGLAGYLAAHGPITFAGLCVAARYATVVASFAVESFSHDRLIAATRRDIEQRLRELPTTVGCL